jgi:hypothetical protein
MLTNFDIERFFEHKRFKGKRSKKFGGVFCKDELKNMVPEDKIYIFNLDDSTGGGTHWTMASFLKPSFTLYFDSYGTVPDDQILDFMKRAKSKTKTASQNPNVKREIIYSTIDYQPFESDKCGWYCLYVAKQLMANKSVTDTLLNFETGYNKWMNDILVKTIDKDKIFYK